MSLFDSICCCVGINKNKSKSLQKFEDQKMKNPPVIVGAPVRPTLDVIKNEDIKLQTSVQNLKVEVEPKDRRYGVEPESILLQKYRRSSQKNYGDDRISAEFNDKNARKIKTISKQQFFVLPCEPVMQFYQHETLQIQGMLPTNDIQYY